jgi:hypothetical protein
LQVPKLCLPDNIYFSQVSQEHDIPVPRLNSKVPVV